MNSLILGETSLLNSVVESKLNNIGKCGECESGNWNNIINKVNSLKDIPQMKIFLEYEQHFQIVTNHVQKMFQPY